MKLHLGRIALASSAFIGILGVIQVHFLDKPIEPAAVLFILTTTCAIGFLVLSEKN